jgi:hypothetical protein
VASQNPSIFKTFFGGFFLFFEFQDLKTFFGGFFLFFEFQDLKYEKNNIL